MHQRHAPFQYQFKYSVLSVRVDIDELDQLDAQNRFFSIDRFNVFSLHKKDYGPRTDQDWREWMQELLADYGLKSSLGRIELVCFARFLGYQFNPLAMWYVYDSADNLVSIVAEVSNTFGQWHHYVLAQSGQPLENSLKAKAQKSFHVSPFINMDCEYRFRLTKPDQNYSIGIYQFQNNQPLLVATQVGRKVEFSQRNLLKAAVLKPFNTLKVIVLIHWWALKIWLKGGKFHKTPSAQEAIGYSHTEMKLC
jgi:DUF1365 family protein